MQLCCPEWSFSSLLWFRLDGRLGHHVSQDTSNSYRRGTLLIMLLMLLLNACRKTVLTDALNTLALLLVDDWRMRRRRLRLEDIVGADHLLSRHQLSLLFLQNYLWSNENCLTWISDIAPFFDRWLSFEGRFDLGRLGSLHVQLGYISFLFNCSLRAIFHNRHLTYGCIGPRLLKSLIEVVTIGFKWLNALLHLLYLLGQCNFVLSTLTRMELGCLRWSRADTQAIWDWARNATCIAFLISETDLNVDIWRLCAPVSICNLNGRLRVFVRGCSVWRCC